MRRVLLWLVRWYRSRLSPGMPPRCRYVPTCSDYAQQCLEQFTIFRAIPLIVWRLLRCNPFSHGGIDPVPLGRQERNDIGKR